MKKENQRVAISKRILKDGLMKLLNKKHINDISVIELCEVSQINRTTFYRHYQTPYDVLLDIQRDYIESFNVKSISPIDSKDLKKYTIRLCEFIYEHKELVKLFIKNKTDDDFSDLFQMFSDSFLGDKEILYKGRPVSSEALQLMLTFFANGSYAVVKQWIMEDIPIASEEVASLLYGSYNQDITFR